MDDRQKALERAILSIEKQYGKGSIMKLGETAARLNIETIPTGSLALDIALGVGGIPRGRVVEDLVPVIGKTTLCLHLWLRHRKGWHSGHDWRGTCPRSQLCKKLVWILIIYLSPSRITVNRVWKLRSISCNGAVDVVVVDSVAALVPRRRLR